MYKTTGIIDKEFYESTKCHVYHQKRIVLLKICIAILVVDYLMEAFLTKDLKWTLICVFALSLYSFAYFGVLKKYAKINLKRLQESYHADAIDMSTEFTEDAMLISSSIRQDVTEIYYQDISRVVLTSKYYLIFTKAEQLICVFADQLQERERLGLIGFLKEKVKVECGDNLLLSVEKKIIVYNGPTYRNGVGLMIPGMLQYFDYEELLG